ncbi:MAG: Rid family hydrolase [Kiloniellales bacterium]|nr:Rid family hydrolase [Kiloniellales bacterium]
MRWTLITGMIILASMSSTAKSQVEYLTREDSVFKKFDLPFSEAVRVGDTLYLSGQIGTKPGTIELIEGGIGPETRQTMENIRTVLEANGSSLDSVVKCTLMLADIAEWREASEVYRGFFTERLPARSAFATTGLALGARVEIECLAYVGKD